MISLMASPMSSMDLDDVQKAYSRWSRVYDMVFGPTFATARRRAVAMLELQEGERVLEVGVGTGLSFPEFPLSCSAYGIDISRPMLKRAKARARRPGTGIAEADACQLPFGNDAFDAALIPYVLSAVPDPIGLLQEAVRVVRPDGSIVLLNHFMSDNKMLAACERLVTKTTTRLLGFHADLAVDPALEAVGLRVVASRRVPPLRYWQALCVVAANGNGALDG